MSSNFIFVTGGVVSGLGKGVTGASLGMLLKKRGLKVNMMKLDPYLNVDPGTMNPFQHGEVFVTENGAETDLDLGHYERYLDQPVSENCSITTGQIYSKLLAKERAGGLHGSTMQVIPHVTDTIKAAIYKVAEENAPDVTIVEIGGTVGDIESLPFIEAISQMSREMPEERCIFIHVTLVPYLKASGELKTKPTQHSVAKLLSLGIQPNVLVCRTEHHLDTAIKEKIAYACAVPLECVIENNDCETIYEVPLMLAREGLDSWICQYFGYPEVKIDLSEWQVMVGRLTSPEHQVSIALVGKYVALHDAYMSVVEALKHSGGFHNTKVQIKWIDSEMLNMDNAKDYLADVDGILVPGGFGVRGVEGKIAAVHYARTNNIPFFGICLGLHMAVIEYARHVLGWEGANSTELDVDTPYPVIDLMPDQAGLQIGGTMRMGAYECQLVPGTFSAKAYGQAQVSERHRHRYELNPKLEQEIFAHGLKIAGINPERKLVEIVEIPEHPWFVAVQFHPEFISRPGKPQPLFRDFIGASLKNKK